MNYKDTITEFLSKCTGSIANVSYELYTIINSLSEEEQIQALMFLCKARKDINSDFSKQVKNYYTQKQLDKAANMLGKKFKPFLQNVVNYCACNGKPFEEFCAVVWETVQGNSICKTNRERALALFEIINSDNIPYQIVGPGKSMDEEEYSRLINEIGEETFNTNSYILKLRFEQKTQRASILLDKLLSIDDYNKQVVFLSVLLDQIENEVKSDLKQEISKL